MGQGTQQASVAALQEDEAAHAVVFGLTNANAMPADSRTAALSAMTLFFMMLKKCLFENEKCKMVPKGSNKLRGRLPDR